MARFSLKAAFLGLVALYAGMVEVASVTTDLNDLKIEEIEGWSSTCRKDIADSGNHWCMDKFIMPGTNGPTVCLEKCKQVSYPNTPSLFGVKNVDECWCNKNSNHETPTTTWLDVFKNKCANSDTGGASPCLGAPRKACGNENWILIYEKRAEQENESEYPTGSSYYDGEYYVGP